MNVCVTSETGDSVQRQQDSFRAHEGATGNIDDYNDIRQQNAQRLREYMTHVKMVRVRR